MGYDVDRFQDLGPFGEELICSICGGIFEEPAVTPCLHTFCADCVSEWFKQERTCPVCRKPVPRLSRSPLVVSNLLGKLKVKCQFEDKGCPVVHSLDSVKHHLETCSFKPKTRSLGTFFRRLLTSWSRAVGAETYNDRNEVRDDYDAEPIARRFFPVYAFNQWLNRTDVEELVGVGAQMATVLVVVLFMLLFSKVIDGALDLIMDLLTLNWVNVGDHVGTGFALVSCFGIYRLWDFMVNNRLVT